MKTFTDKERAKLHAAITKAETLIKKMSKMHADVLFQHPVDESALWKLQNDATEVSAVLYNIHGGVYLPAVRS